jgi:aminoglycoside/choline kinase family phosphotransferase
MDHSLLLKLFSNKFNTPAKSVLDLPPSGSSRRYCRISNEQHTAMGVYNSDKPENKAFIDFSRHFYKQGLSVPEIYEVDPGQEYYLLEDLGDETLKDYGDKIRQGDEIPRELIKLYKDALKELIQFQIKGHDGLDYSVCVPRDEYDRQSVLWDLNHFKYFFLKLSGIPFNEQQLENDFQEFSDYLSQADANSFLFRDFQSRNIMYHNNKLYFIDYQGGRKGALQYDPASLLFEAKTNLPPSIREELLEYYLDELSKYRETDRRQFKEYYYPFALIRIFQALGAYGLRGLIEKKPVFLQSIPLALANLGWILHHVDLPVKMPELIRVADALIGQKRFTIIPEEKPGLLTIRIFSFSYRKGIPDDLSGHGGGFVFDCRGIHNPGRYLEYRELTGKDEPVKLFLNERSKMPEFLKDVSQIISRHIEFYQENNYSAMQVSFGCTGGRHRSVYAAEKITEELNKRHDIRVILRHTEI